MKSVSKIFAILSNVIILYFVVGGLVYRASIGGLKGYGSVVVAPLIFMWDNIGQVGHNIANYGIQNVFLPGGLTSINSNLNSKYWQNNLDKNLFILHVQTGSDNLHLVELKSGNVLNTIILPDVRTNSSDRWMVFLDKNDQVVYAYLGDKGILYKLDITGKILQTKKFNDGYHHRLNVVEGHIFVNIFRNVKNLKQNFRDEGYLKLDSDLNIIDEFWLGDHIIEFPLLASSGSFNKWGEDPFHLNDVEVVPSLYNSTNKQSSTLIGGDVLLSARHLNSIIVVREGKIWSIERGSFNLQHDVDVVNDSIISISNNNSSCSYVGLCDVSGIKSNIVHYNIRTGKERVKYDNVGFSTQTEGQVQYLESGRVVIENQNNNEFIIVDKDKLVFRGGIMSKIHVGFLDMLTWEQAFDENPFK